MLRAGRALQALKPCFMMGPLSVAQLLPRGTLKFDYIVMEDESGRMDVWYNTAQRRCPPRLGATVTADGNVVDVAMMDIATGERVTRQVFVAGSISIDDEPPLADDEVRLCQLPMAEQQMLALEGLERLEDFWSANGKRVRTVVYD